MVPTSCSHINPPGAKFCAECGAPLRQTCRAYRLASGQIERYPGLAAELVRLNVDVIVAPATPQALAAKQATSSMPVRVADAVGAGLITNFARPGGNITGLTSSSAELGGKRLELLKQMVPKASRVAVLYNPTDRSNVLILKQLQESVPT